jgi:hypothetical protein
MGLKFRRGSTAQQSGSLAFGEPYVNTTLGTLVVGGATGDIVLSTSGTGSTGNFGAISGSGLDITGNANIAGNVTVGGQLTIGDQTSDTVNVVASLSSSLIPQTTNAFDLGSATKIWKDLYISTGSIKFVEGTSVVKTLSAATLTALEIATGSSNASVTALNSFTSSIDTTIKTKINTDGIISSSAQIITNLPTGTVSGSSQLTNTFAGLSSVNTFTGNQTITGSLYITQDLVVQGSASIQTISSSRLDIGDNIIQLNVNSPSLRFGGIEIYDSGLVGNSGSFLYDSLHDEFIFVHKGNGTNVTSSHFVLGPETYDNLGTETYLTNNRLPKGTGKEHLNDSNITDTGTLITLGSNTFVNGTFYATGTTLVSGSSQITYASISSIPAGIVSGSAQVTPLLPTGVVSGSAQTIANLPTGTVSGSSQVTLSSTTGYGTVINQNLLTTSDVRHNSLGIGMTASGTAGRIDASGDIVAYSTSDINFKENITPIENPIEKIKMISGNTYDWKTDMKEFHGFEGNDVGVIAQEIEAVLPQLVTTRETGYKAVKYDKLVALLIEGIKTQQSQIEKLESEIAGLQNVITVFEDRMKEKGLL